MKWQLLSLLFIAVPLKLLAQGGYIGYVSASDCNHITIERQGHLVACNGPSPLYINDRLAVDQPTGNLVQRLHLRSDVEANPQGKVYILILKPKAQGGVLDGLKECIQYIKTAWFKKDYAESNSATRGFGANAPPTQELFPSSGSSVGLLDTILLQWVPNKYTKLMVKNGSGIVAKFDLHNIDSLSLALEPLRVRENARLIFNFTGNRDTGTISLRIIPKAWNMRIQRALQQNIPDASVDPHLQKALIYQAISDASRGEVDLYWKSYQELRQFAATGDVSTPLYQTLLDRYFSYTTTVGKSS